MTRQAFAVLLLATSLGMAACRPAAAPDAAPVADAVVPAAAAAPSTPTPAPQMASVQPELARQVNAQIDSEGAKAVVAALDKDDARFNQISEAIATADPVWLTIALRLREGSDAGTSETLRISAARALPEAPERVLALVGHGFELSDLCTSPFIEPEPGVAEAYAAKAIAALQSVTDPALKTTVDECIKGVALP